MVQKREAQKRSSKAKTISELELIERIRQRAGSLYAPQLRLGIGDDCALLGLRRGEEAAVTTDLSLDGRHFRLDWHPARSVGHRTLARGLSDLAAMGARPLAVFLSLGLPRPLTQPRGKKQSWIDGFYDGLLALAEQEKTPLAGGDLSESPLALADVVLVGAIEQGQALRRSGARPGDLLYVTGELGAAALGLQMLVDTEGRAEKSRKVSIQKQLERHLYPQPRLVQGRKLRGLATAAMDLSDGLSIDLARLCAASGVAAEVDAARLPIAPGASISQALDGGEDYELLFTARPTTRLPRAIAGVPLTCIGRILAPRKHQPPCTVLIQNEKKTLAAAGWEHFS
ncbi:thiamine-phosphate kinase [Telmatobacter bradus]|uniref:thiamine-phosphate kinase n=1 Tax=Telmatobacter bradus TaxID=474953 RepID=UPI003B432590